MDMPSLLMLGTFAVPDRRSRPFTISLFLLALAAPLPLAPTAHAYVIEGGNWPQAHPGDPVTITYSYHNLLDGGLLGPDGIPLPALTIRASVEEAFSLWASVAPLNFVEVPDEGGPVVQFDYPDGQFGQIRLAHTYINGPDIPGQPPAFKAYTYYPINGGNIAGDVFYDDGDPWQLAGTLPTPDILGASIHEFGHALGLGHSNDPTSNMYPIFTRYNGPGTGASLKPDDIEGIRAIYGAGTGSVTPLPVPEPAALSLLLIPVAAWFARRKPARELRLLPL